MPARPAPTMRTLTCSRSVDIRVSCLAFEASEEVARHRGGLEEAALGAAAHLAADRPLDQAFGDEAQGGVGAGAALGRGEVARRLAVDGADDRLDRGAERLRRHHPLEPDAG